MEKFTYKKFIENCKNHKNGKITIEEILGDAPIRKFVGFEVKLAIADFLRSTLINSSNQTEENGFEGLGAIFRDYEVSKLNMILSCYINIAFKFI